ncbi:hypothetical protein [Treponema sp. R6D11]
MPSIEVSCPSCGKENIIEMNFREQRKDGMAELLMSMMGDMGIKSYNFYGDGCCPQCGQSVDVLLTVGGGVKNKKDSVKIITAGGF